MREKKNNNILIILNNNDNYVIFTLTNPIYNYFQLLKGNKSTIE